MDNGPLLELSHITKRYSGVTALDDVHLALNAGEILSLAGENGAGKSTLVKIISGAVSRDSGDVRIGGDNLPLQYSPSDARKYGIAMIYQELSLLSELTVAENIFLAHEPQHVPWFPVINYRQMYEKSRELLSQLKADHIDVRTKVASLPLPEQHMVEIAKALAFECRIFVMDEPTTSLSWQEIKQLFNVVRSLKEQGVTIIYISHHLDELFQIADRVTVLRDGKIAGQEKITDIDKEHLIHLMTGKKLVNYRGAQGSAAKEKSPKVLLDVKGISGKRLPHEISFQVYENEVLGFGGLVGSRRTEMARTLFGADKQEDGTITFKGKKIAIASPNQAVKQGIGYLSEDRKEEGLNLGMSIQENIVYSNLRSVSKGIFFLWKRVQEICAHFIDALRIKGSAPQLVSTLSGGNQQKVVIAKWLHTKCDLLIFDEPTRGIDVGAKADIHKLISNFAKNEKAAKAAIVISTEVNELIDVCDRVIIMSKGSIIKILDGDELTEDNIVRHTTMQKEIL